MRYAQGGGLTDAERAARERIRLQGFLGHVPVAGMLGLVALQSCFVAGGGPASRTFIPHLLPKQQLAAGLALRRIAFQGAMLLGHVRRVARGASSRLTRKRGLAPDHLGKVQCRSGHLGRYA